MIGIICEIDETLIVRRKYARGRLHEKKDVWLFGGIERETKHQQCFLAVIEGKRSAQNLIPLITKYIRPGSIIHSDL